MAHRECEKQNSARIGFAQCEESGLRLGTLDIGRHDEWLVEKGLLTFPSADLMSDPVLVFVSCVPLEACAFRKQGEGIFISMNCIFLTYTKSNGSSLEPLTAQKVGEVNNQSSRHCDRHGPRYAVLSKVDRTGDLVPEESPILSKT